MTTPSPDSRDPRVETDRIPAIDDPRVTALTLAIEPSMPKWFDDYDRNDMANQSARVMIGQCEAAGLLVLLPDDARIERITKANRLLAETVADLEANPWLVAYLKAGEPVLMARVLAALAGDPRE